MQMILIVLLLSASCLGFPNIGDPSQHLEGRLIGGVNVDIENYPYQLSLEYLGHPWSGAAIVSNNWAVTAAHSVQGLQSSIMKSFTYKQLNTEMTLGTMHPASEIIIHPNFKEDPYDFDVALVKVSTPFTFGAEVAAITLATEAPKEGELGSMVGWGYTNNGGGSLSSHIQVVSLPIVGRVECDEKYGVPDGLGETFICIGYDLGGKDVCSYDAGGPYVVGGKLVAIMAGSSSCNTGGYPQIYTNATAVADFINNNI
ncbi:hypothetical protein L9F63_011246 [Diploptera punctata]|uniref:Peptidase S1 domain-containing protein n=1 Tax=Diploptera punctata TaxID=6984 RepID=A0AAD8EP30_DIPPU|nr:hypothetical protein L9F63_011246 [Diploptera punctata]